MDGDYGLSDLRFAGYSNEELASQVDGLRNGQGAESLHNAARALVSLASGLAETDRVLREQLQQIGVSWEGQAAEGGVQATQDAAVYADEAVGPVGESAAGVSTQSGSFSHTRNSAPDSGTLRGPTEMTGFDRFAGAFGHTTDHAQAVQDTGAARDQAVAGMDGYQRSSADSLGRAQTLPVPPGMDLVARPPDNSTQVSGVGAPGVGGGTGPGGGPGGPGVPGSAGGQGGGPGAGPGPLSGAPGTPGAPPGGPGPTTGIGPVTPPGQGLPGGPGAPGAPRGVPSPFIPAAAAIAGAGAGGAAMGASAERDRVVRGGRPGAPGTPGTAATPPKGAAPLATPPDDEARAARNAERFGARQGKPAGGAIMQPATGAARKEEDATHVRKYGVDSGDVFEDGRLTAPALIGDDEDTEKKAD